MKSKRNNKLLICIRLILFVSIPVLTFSGCISVGRISIPRDAARVMMAVVVDEYRTPEQAIVLSQKQSSVIIDPIALLKISPSVESRKWVNDYQSIIKTAEFFTKLEDIRHSDIYKWIEILLTLKEIDKTIVKQALIPLLNENKEMFITIAGCVLK